MKICVFSDSHRDAWGMIRAIRAENPDLCFFLGDGERDLEDVQACFPLLPFMAVRGNCDLFSQLPLELRCAAGGIEFYAAHGHMHGVKHDRTLSSLKTAARKAGAEVVLFGHTHQALLRQEGGLTLMNPGPASGRDPSYGVLWKDGDRLHCEIKRVSELDGSAR